MPIVRSYYKVLRVVPEPSYFYMKNEYSGSTDLRIKINGTPASTDLSYSYDKVTWTDIHSGGNISVQTGDIVYFRSTTGFSNANGFYTFDSYQSFSVGGNILTLLDYTNTDDRILPSNAFRQAFSGSTNLISAGNLDCSGIIGAVDSSLASMFYGCSSLTTVPDFSNLSSAVGQQAMGSMFSGCSSLTTAPDFSNLTEIGGNGCLQRMFENCSSLTAVPDFSGIVTVTGNSPYAFYYTFSGCTSLTRGADFSGITNANASDMFGYCYNGSSSISAVFTPNVSNFFSGTNWLSGAAANGTVYAPAGQTISTDSDSGIPSGWTRVDY